MESYDIYLWKEIQNYSTCLSTLNFISIAPPSLHMCITSMTDISDQSVYHLRNIDRYFVEIITEMAPWMSFHWFVVLWVFATASF